MTTGAFKHLKVGDTVQDLESGLFFIVREKYEEDNDICICDESGWTVVVDYHKLRRLK